MGENKSLIDLSDMAGLAEPAKALIEKVSDAIGVLYEPTRIRKKAEAEAQAAIMQANSQIEISEIQQRGLVRMIQLEGIKQQNIEQITAKATESLDEKAVPKDMDNDWVANFFDKCELVSDDEMQSLWAKILAGEANKPGTYSKRTVNSLNSFEKSEAHLFTTLCRFGWMIGGVTPLIFNLKDEIYSSNGINFNTVSHLESIGLVKSADLTSFSKQGLPEEFNIMYYGNPLKLKLPEKSKGILNVGKVLLTRIGQELAPICGSQAIDGFVDYAKEQWKKSGVIFES